MWVEFEQAFEKLDKLGINSFVHIFNFLRVQLVVININYGLFYVLVSVCIRDIR